MSDGTDAIFDAIQSFEGPKQSMMEAINGFKETIKLLDELEQMASDSEIDQAVHQLALIRQRVEGYQQKLSAIRHDTMMDRDNLLEVRQMR